jgi:tetratricopeptide (TPR) repeat protein
MAWVLYDLLKQNTEKENFDIFIGYLQELVNLNLGSSDKMVINQMLWVIGTAAFEFTKEDDFDISKMEQLLDLTMKLPFTRQSKGYSFLFKALHKALKESPRYIDFASWWDLWCFISDDYHFKKRADGKKKMAIAEQGFNRYAKHLVKAFKNAPDPDTELELIKKIDTFMPIIEVAMQHNSHYSQLPYYKIKFLFIKGEFTIAYELLLTRARQRKTDFWIWKLMAEAYADKPEKQIGCLAKAILCKPKDSKIVKTHIKLAYLLIEHQKYDEAKTEIGTILKWCLQHKQDIPDVVSEWGEQAWYNQATAKTNNMEFYNSASFFADEILYGEIPERKIVVDSVNVPKKIITFIDGEYSKGYFKYDRIIKQATDGDIFSVRLKPVKGIENRYTLHGATKLDDKFIDGIIKHFSGEVIKPIDRNFAFVEGMFVTPLICAKHHIEDGDYVSGRAMVAYNNKKDEWGWKVVAIDE